jgi:D-aspartate ligase
MHKLRKSPPFFGVCRVAEPWPEDRLREPTVALLARIGYRGMANAEYKLDPRDGKLRLMEVNGRPFLMAGLARRAGIDLVRLAWAEATGAPPPPATYNGWRGRWIHLHADLLYALLFHRAEGIGLRDYVEAYLGKKAFAVWSLADPLPFAAQWSRTLRDAVFMTGDRRHRDALRSSVQLPTER